MNRAFSLVELSIVLVILGLLTGGILAGQSLIRASELRSIITESQRVLTAASSFRDRYFAIPGDMRNATSFWGTMTNCGVASPSGTGTCNGNGDGFINNAAAASQTGENYGFWQQLGNAGLIEGSYTGIAGSVGVNDANYGSNTMASKLSNGGWTVGARTAYTTGSTVNFDGFWRNWLYVQGDGNGATTPLLLPEEIWNLDTKSDDGRPGTGKVVAKYADNCTNAANGADFAATYSLSNTSRVCDYRVIEAF